MYSKLRGGGARGALHRARSALCSTSSRCTSCLRACIARRSSVRSHVQGGGAREKVVMEDAANTVGVEFVKYCGLYVVLVSLLQLLWDRLVDK